MNNLHNIVVYIKDEAMLQEAREILLKNGQRLAHDGTFILSNNENLNFLKFFKEDNIWYLGMNLFFNQELCLEELEQRLKRQYEESKQIAINLTKGA